MYVFIMFVNKFILVIFSFEFPDKYELCDSSTNEVSYFMTNEDRKLTVNNKVKICKIFK